MECHCINDIIAKSYNLLLTKEEVNRAKSGILRRMKKYSGEKTTSQVEHPSYLDKYFQKQITVDTTPLEKILNERNVIHSSDALKSFWFSKIETTDKPLAYVAIDILGIVITSVASERSFSRGRLIINDQRTRISPDHARQQMIIQINQEIAKEVISRTNLI